MYERDPIEVFAAFLIWEYIRGDKATIPDPIGALISR